MKKIKIILAFVLGAVLCVSCEDPYFNYLDEEFQEDIIEVRENGEYTGELWNYAENNYYYAIAGLSSAPNRFLYITTYTNGGYPSYTVVELLSLDKVREEIEWQNKNLSGHAFSSKVQPCVYEGQFYWKSECQASRSVLLIGTYKSHVRSNVFWRGWDVRYKFTSNYSLQLYQYGTKKYWYLQLRVR